MDHIDGLAEEAQKDGGYVHRLIGNHEAMNVYGDLRYVTTPEFEAFEGRNSKVIRNRYFDLVMEDLANRDPEAFAALPENYREQWDAEHPLGWVEHRQAWDPAWNRDGEYFLRAEDLKAAVKINDTVFVHGGISDIYAGMPLSEMTQQAHQQMANFDFENPGLIADECGPFWYRGISGESPEASPEVLTSILERLSAERIVVGHTPTPGFVWPRYQGRVVQIDTGIAEHYGGYPAYLEITANGLVAGYPGGKVHLPTSDEARAGYLEQVIALDPDRKTLPLIRDRLLAASEIEAAVDLQESEETAEAEAEGESEEVTEAQAVVDPCLRAAGE
jgi:hypothetical protein